MNSYRVGIAGFGAIGQAVAQSLDAGLPGLTLAAVAVRDPQAAPAVAWRNAKPVFTTIGELADHCDVVVECAPAAVFRELAGAGTLLGYDVLSATGYTRNVLFLLAPGAFFATGFLIWIVNAIHPQPLEEDHT